MNVYTKISSKYVITKYNIVPKKKKKKKKQIQQNQNSP
jgi:hypothetical protein